MKLLFQWFHFHLRFVVNPRSTPFIVIILLAILLQACGSPGGSKNSSQQGNPSPESVSSNSNQPDELEQAMTLEQALNTVLDDNRQQVLDQMGPPDIFKITFQDLNGRRVRQEEWSYFNDQTRFDFINGALLWTVSIESVPDLSLNASTYDPLSFIDGMSVEEVQTLLEGQQLTPIDLADYGVPSGQALVGDQLLLGFEGGRLVSVQTFELEPGVAQ
jgi:hypothetical protein